MCARVRLPGRVGVCIRVRVRLPGCVGVCMHVALLIQHATRLRHIVMPFVAPLAPLYFSTFHVNKKVTKRKMCFDFLYNVCLKRVSF
jgi:hypothetical protein